MKKFYGDDWTELSEHWGINLELEDDEVLKQTQAYMRNAMNDKPLCKQVAKDLRRFLRALYKQSVKMDYHHTIWKGLLDINKDQYGDECLVHFSMELLGYMWT